MTTGAIGVQASELVKKLKIGNSVAEFDEHLDSYFLETETFRSVVDGRFDVIAGDKGTGKTAIYRTLKRSYRGYKALEAVELVDAFNVQGNPIFSRLTLGPRLTEGQYRTFWKAYIFSLVGNYLLDIYGSNYSPEIQILSNTLEYLDLLSIDPTPETIFGKLHSLVKRISDPKSVEAGISITETGMPIITPKIELGDEKDRDTEIFNDDFLLILQKAALSTEFTYWVLFDRLDEAFATDPEIEVPALRALMRTYLDLAGLDNVKLKLFVRRDLFRRVVHGGFVNLTHINARRVDIIWDDEDLMSMIVKRISQNNEFMKSCLLENKTDSQVLEVVFPAQIDAGEKRPTTQKWMISRIRDGSDAKPPRNLIDLVNKASEAQSRKDARDPRTVDPEIGPVIEAGSIKRAHSQLSEQRVQDTLLAEGGSVTRHIEKFRDGKSEHNLDSLAALLGEDFRRTIQSLIEMGFLEQLGMTFKIPSLYRDGLKITQGKAF